MYQVEVAERPERRVIGVAHRGAYNQIGGAFRTLGAVASEAGLWPQALEVLGVFQDDPREVAEADLRSMAGIAVAEVVESIDLPSMLLAVVDRELTDLVPEDGDAMGETSARADLGQLPGVTDHHHLSVSRRYGLKDSREVSGGGHASFVDDDQ